MNAPNQDKGRSENMSGSPDFQRYQREWDEREAERQREQERREQLREKCWDQPVWSD